MASRKEESSLLLYSQRPAELLAADLKISAPSTFRASASGPSGLLLSCSSPVIVTGMPRDAAIGSRRYSVVPLFPASISMLSGSTAAEESTNAVDMSLLKETFAPSAFTASMHDSVSEDISGWRIMLISLEKYAIRNALIVWLFDAGTSIVPEGREGESAIIAPDCIQLAVFRQ